MKFFVGMHIPAHADKVENAFISVNRIRNRKGAFPVKNWIMDSGAFTTIAKHGGYIEPVSVYAEQIKRWKDNGNLLAAVAQDYMCEPHMLAKTGMTVEQHQKLTVERYDALIAEDTGVYIMPVLQGYDPQDYVNHINMYGKRLAYGSYVGVGSVCKRNSDPQSIVAVIKTIKQCRSDLRLHGFGVKTTSLALSEIRDELESADSMAWSFSARMEGKGSNDWRNAVKFEKKIKMQPVQMALL
jgi:hypothetical protein